MDRSAHDLYLEMQLKSATPQKLRCLLIEGAARFGRLAETAGAAGDWEGFYEACVRCRAIVNELAAAVRVDLAPPPDEQHAAEGDVIVRTRAMYLALFRLLTKAINDRDPGPLGETLLVLDEERATWRRLCELMPEAPSPTLLAEARSQPPAAAAAAPPPLPKFHRKPLAEAKAVSWDA